MAGLKARLTASASRQRHSHEKSPCRRVAVSQQWDAAGPRDGAGLLGRVGVCAGVCASTGAGGLGGVRTRPQRATYTAYSFGSPKRRNGCEAGAAAIASSAGPAEHTCVAVQERVRAAGAFHAWHPGSFGEAGAKQGPRGAMAHQ